MGYGSSGGVLPSEMAEVQARSFLNMMKIAVNGALAGQLPFADGFLDAFIDSSGVDGASSTTESYDAANDLYKMDTVFTDQLTGGTPSQDDTQVGHEAALACDDNDATYAQASGTDAWWWKYDFGAGNEKTLTELGFKSHASGAIGVFKLQGSNNDADWDDIISDTGANNDNWQYFSGTNTTAYRYYRIYVGTNYDGGAANRPVVCEFMVGVPNTGFTLVSNNYTADAEDPAEAKPFLFVDYNGESITLNTDILAYISMDNGSNFEQFTLTDGGLYEADHHILTADDLSLTAQGNKEMVLKFVAANSKDVYLEAWGASWRW